MKKVSSWGVHNGKQDWRTDNWIPVLDTRHSGCVSHGERRARIFGRRAGDGFWRMAFWVWGTQHWLGWLEVWTERSSCWSLGSPSHPSLTTRIGSQWRVAPIPQCLQTGDCPKACPLLQGGSQYQLTWNHPQVRHRRCPLMTCPTWRYSASWGAHTSPLSSQ